METEYIEETEIAVVGLDLDKSAKTLENTFALAMPELEEELSHTSQDQSNDCAQFKKAIPDVCEKDVRMLGVFKEAQSNPMELEMLVSGISANDTLSLAKMAHVQLHSMLLLHCQLKSLSSKKLLVVEKESPNEVVNDSLDTAVNCNQAGCETEWDRFHATGLQCLLGHRYGM
ncbi:hypothetical protein BDQ17DRAFT_1336798 [Cyathus striatus]|nr:hypothetical protein BDQ17DRAFT_1336798 [Cyathus striatus]